MFVLSLKYARVPFSTNRNNVAYENRNPQLVVLCVSIKVLLNLEESVDFGVVMTGPLIEFLGRPYWA